MSLNNVLSSSQLVVGQGTELTLGLLGLSTNCRRKDLLSLLKSRPISAVKSIIVYCTYQVWYIALCYHCIHASDICCNLAWPVSTSEVLWMTSVFGEMCSWKPMTSVDIWKRTASLLRYFFCSQVTVLFTFLSVHLWGYFHACATSCSAHSVRCKRVFIVSFMACCGEVKSNEELLHWVCECRVTTVASQALIVPVSTSFFAATNSVWYALSSTARQCFFGAATALPYCNLTDWSYFAISVNLVWSLEVISVSCCCSSSLHLVEYVVLVGLQVVATVAFGMGLDKSDVGAVSQPSFPFHL